MTLTIFGLLAGLCAPTWTLAGVWWLSQPTCTSRVLQTGILTLQAGLSGGLSVRSARIIRCKVTWSQVGRFWQSELYSQVRGPCD